MLPINSFRRGVVLAAFASVAMAAALGAAAPHHDILIEIDPAVRDSMNAIWARSNLHWNELAGENTLTQMLGTGKPTQREYLGCLRGRRFGETLRIFATEPARDMKQLQFAVAGNCNGVPDLVGTWHTHPFRADSAGHALKERVLSRQDLDTFETGADAAVVVVWDIDSLDVAVRDLDGTVMHPVAVHRVIP